MDFFGAPYPWAEYSVFSQLRNVGTKTLGMTAASSGSGLEISSLCLLSLLSNRPSAWMAHGSSAVSCKPAKRARAMLKSLARGVTTN